jgi:hypothetical protein
MHDRMTESQAHHGDRTMTGCSDIKRIGDRLEQVDAILACEGGLHRPLSAVRSLLSGFSGTAFPTHDMRRRWIDMLETMLRLDAKVATVAEAADLLRHVEQLRRAVRAHEADIGP